MTGRTSLVGALLFSDGEVLLGRRNPARASYPGVWDVPGGHVEVGETLAAALVRELDEELGIVVCPGEPWRTMTQPPVELTLWIITEWEGTVVNRAPDEHAELRWFDADSSSGLDVPHPSYPGLLAAAFAARSAGRG